MSDAQHTEARQVTDYLHIEKGVDGIGVFIDTAFSDDLHIAEALGMLEFAKAQLLREFYDPEPTP